MLQLQIDGRATSGLHTGLEPQKSGPQTRRGLQTCHPSYSHVRALPWAGPCGASVRRAHRAVPARADTAVRVRQ
eukprot:scaffold59219_cov36-Phaeocystis_antarctica.AAC.1